MDMGLPFLGLLCLVGVFAMGAGLILLWPYDK